MLYFTNISNTFKFSTKPLLILPAWSDTIILRDTVLGGDHTHIVLHSNRLPASEHFFQKGTVIYDEHILKSNLQKTFRRQLLDPCLATAMQLLKQSPADFLRRLAVVLLEDSQLHAELYTGVIWYMCAVPKNYKLYKDDVQLLMDAITTGLECTEYYDLARSVPHKPLSAIKSANLADAWMAIKLRAAAGGMKCDTAFLNRLADRLAAADLPLIEEWSSVQLEDIEKFSVDQHIIDEAIDFHCCRELLGIAQDIAKEAGITATKAQIQDAIWWNWSSFNLRSLSENELKAAEIRNAEEKATEALWKIIQPAVEKFSQRRIKQLEEEAQHVKCIQTLDKWFTKC